MVLDVVLVGRDSVVLDVVLDVVLVVLNRWEVVVVAWMVSK